MKEKPPSIIPLFLKAAREGIITGIKVFAYITTFYYVAKWIIETVAKTQ